MRIEKIEMVNFRSFSNVDIQLDGRNALFFGINGAGKTSILDAISILLSRFVLRFATGEKKPIVDTDITYGKSTLILNIQVSDILELTQWGLRRDRKHNRIIISNFEQLKIISEVLLMSLDEKSPPSLPILVYYPVHRAVLDIPLRIRTRHEFDQTSAYTKALSSGADFRLFFEWFRNQEDLENQIRARDDASYEDHQLHAVRHAIYSIMPGYSNLKVVRSPLRMVISKGNRQIQVGQLSDGEKCLMALVGDLARRLALANPGMSNPLEGKGVVLIDEIELHLHPKWQREVILFLSSTFPHIQFIMTTHSPQVLGEAKDMQVFQISSDEQGNSRVEPLPEVLFGRDSNRVLEDYMGAMDRDPDVKKSIETLLDVLMSENWPDAQKILEDLTQLVGQDDPELIRATAILHRKQLIGR